jgi:hypothetical protein
LRALFPTASRDFGVAGVGRGRHLVNQVQTLANVDDGTWFGNRRSVIGKEGDKAGAANATE